MSSLLRIMGKKMVVGVYRWGEEINVLVGGLIFYIFLKYLFGCNKINWGEIKELKINRWSEFKNVC